VFAGIESFSKLGDSIYFEEKGERPALYIIQFIPSTFNWRTAGLTITQKLEPLSSSDHYLQVSLSISAKVNSTRDFFHAIMTENSGDLA
jgi:hypothetical protein